MESWYQGAGKGESEVEHYDYDPWFEPNDVYLKEK